MAEDVQTIPDLVFKKTAGFNKPDCLMVKKGGVYTNISGSEVIGNAEAVASALLATCRRAATHGHTCERRAAPV